MTVGAVVRQGFGVEVPWLPAWHMYRGFGVGVWEVELTRIGPDGQATPVDRLGALGHPSWRLAPMADRRIDRPAQLQRQVQQICASLGDVDLRVRARVARPRGWEVVATGERDACP